MQPRQQTLDNAVYSTSDNFQRQSGVTYDAAVQLLRKYCFNAEATSVQN